MRSIERQAIAAAILIAATTTAAAAQWPTRPIMMIAPFPAGSAADAPGRVIADQVSQALGQPMVIENRPGAGGTLGFAEVARAQPDGYTFVTSSSTMASGPVLHRTLSYDPLRDFIPVVLLGTQPNVLVSSKQSGFKTLADLVAAAKAKPGSLTFASGGVGSSSHMAAERLRLAANIDVRHIPFRDGGLNEVMAGRIDYYFIPLAAAAAALSSGNLTVLAVSTAQRAKLLPDVRTVTEAGYPDATSEFWLGLSAPAKTPTDIVNKLHDVTEAALETPAVRDKLEKLGLDLKPMSVAEFGKFFRDDFGAAMQVAKDAHIEPAD